ncbi:hypothetical protein HOY80DRAFT_1031030 [Tuber brumale]|nr:hypothetical protein HOY80DRAFT_1031030 [Tuber brumale]
MGTRMASNMSVYDLTGEDMEEDLDMIDDDEDEDVDFVDLFEYANNASNGSKNSDDEVYIEDLEDKSGRMGSQRVHEEDMKGEGMEEAKSFFSMFLKAGDLNVQISEIEEGWQSDRKTSGVWNLCRPNSSTSSGTPVAAHASKTKLM